jgi:hypothetical protein
LGGGGHRGSGGGRILSGKATNHLFRKSQNGNSVNTTHLMRTSQRLDGLQVYSLLLAETISHSAGNYQP